MIPALKDWSAANLRRLARDGPSTIEIVRCRFGADRLWITWNVFTDCGAPGTATELIARASVASSQEARFVSF